MILAPPPAPGPFVGSSFAFTNHWNPTGCASAGGRRELHRRRALRAQPSLVHRAVGITLDLEKLGLSVDLLRVSDERAADRTVRTQRVDFFGAGNPQVERSLLCRGEVEPKGICKWNERHAGGAGGSELQELTTRDFRHRTLAVLLRRFCVRKADARFLA